ncbi:MAG: potassium transporter [Gammaproteobacteria bacterium]|nr:MAG: potassium transporter [Gammaproteobacteria bacterium]PIE37050.1 MAG: potassium transporter [Gammaproteobacteria bacterium]
MQIRVIRRVVGALLSLFSGIMLLPLFVGLFYGDPWNSLTPFLGAFVLILTVGLLLFLPVRFHKGQLRVRDGFLAVSLFWLVLGIAGGLPLYLYFPLDLSMAAAIFESMSGLTTTGATLIEGLDALPKGILFYRQLTQWLGGMGIIVLAIAVLPMLGIGGQQLFRAETPGVTKEKLTPRLAQTAKVLWYIYLGLTIACMAAYWLAGMSVFDAVCHAFSTVAIGGFSTHDASIGYFDSNLIESIAVVFMIISGVNFALHFTAGRGISLRQYWRDEEFRVYIYIIVALTTITSVYLFITHTASAAESFSNALFHVVSIGTTTGFTSEEYFNWPGFLPVLLLFASFSGGCTGSTGGGMKVLRVLLLFKQGQRELSRLLHPSAVMAVKVDSRVIPNNMIDVVWGFFAAYVALLAIMMLLLMAAGLDQVSAFSAVVACLNNLGPGLGVVAANYSGLGDFSLSVLSLAMLFGRLEIFTLLVLFTPAFWRV